MRGKKMCVRGRDSGWTDWVQTHIYPLPNLLEIFILILSYIKYSHDSKQGTQRSLVPFLFPP